MEASSESVTNRLIESEVTSTEARVSKTSNGEKDSAKIQTDITEKSVSVVEESSTNVHRGSITLQRISEGSESTQSSVKSGTEIGETGSLLMRQTKRIVSQDFGDIGSERDSQSRRASEIERSLSEDVFDLQAFEATHSKTTVTKTEVKGSVTETKVVSSESTENSSRSVSKTEVQESFVERKVVSSEATSGKSDSIQDEVDSMKIESKEKVQSVEGKSKHRENEELKEEGAAPVLEMISAPTNLEEGMDLKLQVKLQGMLYKWVVYFFLLTSYFRTG